MYDTNWNKLNLSFGYKSRSMVDKKTQKLKQMLLLVEKLSKDIHFIRIDFYYPNDKIYF